MKIKTKKITLLMGFHSIEAVKPINKTRTQWAYRLTVDYNTINGLWAIYGCNSEDRTFTYRRVE